MKVTIESISLNFPSLESLLQIPTAMQRIAEMERVGDSKFYETILHSLGKSSADERRVCIKGSRSEISYEVADYASKNISKEECRMGAVGSHVYTHEELMTRQMELPLKRQPADPLSVPELAYRS